MNTKDLNSHVGIDPGAPDGDHTTAILFTDYGAVEIVDGKLVVSESLTEEQFNRIMKLWEAHYKGAVPTVIIYDEGTQYMSERTNEKRSKSMKKMRIIAIVWLCVGIPLLIASLAYFVWLTR